MGCGCFFFFKQKTAYEIKECDWSSDVCSSDLGASDDGAVFPSTRGDVVALLLWIASIKNHQN